MTSKPEITLDTTDRFDVQGRTALFHVGKNYRHYRNQKLYTIVNIVWDSGTDCWSVMYREVGVNAFAIVNYTRAFNEFFKKTDTDQFRFTYEPDTGIPHTAVGSVAPNTDFVHQAP